MLYRLHAFWLQSICGKVMHSILCTKYLVHICLLFLHTGVLTTVPESCMNFIWLHFSTQLPVGVHYTIFKDTWFSLIPKIISEDFYNWFIIPNNHQQFWDRYWYLSLVIHNEKLPDISLKVMDDSCCYI